MNALKNFAANVFKTVGGFAAENLLVVEKHGNSVITKQRRSICRGSDTTKKCPYYLPQTDQCSICKCIIEIKSQAKTNRTRTGAIEITHCPKGKWFDEEIAGMYKK